MGLESYGEYLDAVDRMPKGINVGGMVGHCAVRVARWASGRWTSARHDDDIEAMCDLVAEAIDAGALGFSTSRTPLHRVPDGRSCPARRPTPTSCSRSARR